MGQLAMSDKEAAGAAADAIRAWSEVVSAWGAFATTPGEGAMERWQALVEAGAKAQLASARAAAAAGAAHMEFTPFGLTGLFTSAPPGSPAPRAPAAKKAKAAPERGIQALAKPLGRADDLTLIKGVGPKMAEKLNGLGVFHFWQLASLDAATIAKLDAELAAAGRIARDDWVGQAKQLAEDVGA